VANGAFTISGKQGFKINGLGFSSTIRARFFELANITGGNREGKAITNDMIQKLATGERINLDVSKRRRT